MSSVSCAASARPTFRFSTADFPERERSSALRDIFGRTVVKLDIEPVRSEPLHSDATIYQHPGLGVLFGSCSPVRFVHPRELADDDDLSIMIGMWRNWTASMLDRTPVLRSGDGVVMWNAEVGSMTLPSSGRFVTFRVPASAIARLVPDIGKAVARRIPAQSEPLALLRRYIGVFRNAPASPTLQHLAVSHVYDLLALAIGATRDAAEIANGRGVTAARLHSLKADILDNLGQEKLSVAELAKRHNITPRHVQRLFEADGVTFSEFVRQQRLRLAHRLLTSPADQKISAIAFESGFSDLSYFNRSFRQLYGATPSDVRASARR